MDEPPQNEKAIWRDKILPNGYGVNNWINMLLQMQVS
jgi:hypothetical protein